MASAKVSRFTFENNSNSSLKQVVCKLLVPYSDDSTDTEEEERLQVRRSISSFDSETDSSSSSSSLKSTSVSTSSCSTGSEESSDAEFSSDLEKVDGHLTFSPNDGTEYCSSITNSTSKQECHPGRTKGELSLEDLPVIEELKISVEQTDIQLAGHVFSVVESLVVIQTVPGTPALDLDTLLFFENGMAFGQVFDVFGPVKQPLYAIRFNCFKDIQDKNVTVKMPVYFAPQKNEFTSFIFAENLQRMKGCDASWKHDNEPPENYLDYSDDEQEKLAKSCRRQKKYEQKSESSTTNTADFKKRSKVIEYLPVNPTEHSEPLNGFHSTADSSGKHVPFLRSPAFHYKHQSPRNQNVISIQASSLPRVMPSLLRHSVPSAALMPYRNWLSTLSNSNPIQGSASAQIMWNNWFLNSPLLPPPLSSTRDTSFNLSTGSFPLPLSAVSNNGKLSGTHAGVCQNYSPLRVQSSCVQQPYNDKPGICSPLPPPPSQIMPRFSMMMSLPPPPPPPPATALTVQSSSDSVDSQKTLPNTSPFQLSHRFYSSSLVSSLSSTPPPTSSCQPVYLSLTSRQVPCIPPAKPLPPLLLPPAQQPALSFYVTQSSLTSASVTSMPSAATPSSPPVHSASSFNYFYPSVVAPTMPSIPQTPPPPTLSPSHF